MFEIVAYAFEHPGEVLSTITAQQQKNYEAFKRHLAGNTLAGAFDAGVLFGELLLDVMLIIDGATTVAKIGAKIPGLLKLLPRLEELAPALRRGVAEATRAATQEAGASEPVVGARIQPRAAPKKAPPPKELVPEPLAPEPLGGPWFIDGRDPVDRAQFERLNETDKDVGKLRPGEAGAAAELENGLGGRLERTAAGSPGDFVFTDGPHAGKTVDFMLTPDSVAQAEKINRYFPKNAANFSETLNTCISS